MTFKFLCRVAVVASAVLPCIAVYAYYVNSAYYTYRLHGGQCTWQGRNRPVLHGVGVVDSVGINILEEFPEHDVSDKTIFVGGLLKNVLRGTKTSKSDGSGLSGLRRTAEFQCNSR